MSDLPVDFDMDALPSAIFDRVIRALNVACYEWTVGSEKIQVSAALAEMFGFDPDTWTVKRQTELIHPDDRPGIQRGSDSRLQERRGAGGVHLPDAPIRRRLPLADQSRRARTR